MAERADADDVARQSEDAVSRLSQLETRVSSLEESVHKAVDRKRPKVEEILSRRFSSNTSASNSPGATSRAASSTSLLELAEQGDHEAILRFITEQQANRQLILQRTKEGDSALHVAAAKGNLSAVMALASVIKVNDAGYLLRTPLHCAAENGHLRVVQGLVNAGAKVDAKDGDGKTALELAYDKGHNQIVDMLVPNMAQTVPTHTDAIEYLAQKGLSVDDVGNTGDTLLMLAARRGEWFAVEFLLDRGFSATKCGDDKECPLVLAAKNGRTRTVGLLLRHGAASNAEQVMNGLRAAKNAVVGRAFMQEVPDSVRGEAAQCALIDAAKEGRLEVLQALLHCGTDINCKDGDGHTALWNAAYLGHVACVRELVGRGADINAQNSPGLTPLGIARFCNKTDCVSILVEAGASE